MQPTYPFLKMLSATALFVALTLAYETRAENSKQQISANAKTSMMPGDLLVMHGAFLIEEDMLDANVEFHKK